MPLDTLKAPQPVQDDPPELPFYIAATRSTTRPRRALKHGDTFLVVDSHGDIGASAGGADGLFHDDTRFLSRLELRLNDAQPLLLGSNVRDDNTLLAVDLTNPDLYVDGQRVLEKDIVHVARTIFLWQGTAYQRIAVRNHGLRPVELLLSLSFDNDFADLFEVRGEHRARRGTTSQRVIGGAQVLLSYKGLDDTPRLPSTRRRPSSRRIPQAIDSCSRPMKRVRSSCS